MILVFTGVIITRKTKDNFQNRKLVVEHYEFFFGKLYDVENPDSFDDDSVGVMGFTLLVWSHIFLTFLTYSFSPRYLLFGI